MTHQRHSKLVPILLLLVTVLVAQPVTALECSWNLVHVAVKPSGTLTLRVANDLGTEKVLVFCSLNTASAGHVRPEVCTAFYTSSLVALTTGGKISVAFFDTELDSIGWGGTCESIQGQANVGPAINTFRVLPAS